MEGKRGSLRRWLPGVVIVLVVCLIAALLPVWQRVFHAAISGSRSTLAPAFWSSPTGVRWRQSAAITASNRAGASSRFNEPIGAGAERYVAAIISSREMAAELRVADGADDTAWTRRFFTVIANSWGEGWGALVPPAPIIFLSHLFAHHPHATAYLVVTGDPEWLQQAGVGRFLAMGYDVRPVHTSVCELADGEGGWAETEAQWTWLRRECDEPSTPAGVHYAAVADYLRYQLVKRWGGTFLEGDVWLMRQLPAMPGAGDGEQPLHVYATGEEGTGGEFVSMAFTLEPQPWMASRVNGWFVSAAAMRLRRGAAHLQPGGNGTVTGLEPYNAAFSPSGGAGSAAPVMVLAAAAFNDLPASIVWGVTLWASLGRASLSPPQYASHILRRVYGLHMHAALHSQVAVQHGTMMHRLGGTYDLAPLLPPTEPSGDAAPAADTRCTVGAPRAVVVAGGGEWSALRDHQLVYLRECPELTVHADDTVMWQMRLSGASGSFRVRGGAATDSPVLAVRLSAEDAAVAADDATSLRPPRPLRRYWNPLRAVNAAWQGVELRIDAPPPLPSPPPSNRAQEGYVGVVPVREARTVFLEVTVATQREAALSAAAGGAATEGVAVVARAHIQLLILDELVTLVTHQHDPAVSPELPLACVNVGVAFANVTALAGVDSNELHTASQPLRRMAGHLPRFHWVPIEHGAGLAATRTALVDAVDTPYVLIVPDSLWFPERRMAALDLLVTMLHLGRGAGGQRYDAVAPVKEFDVYAPVPQHRGSLEVDAAAGVVRAVRGRVARIDADEDEVAAEAGCSRVGIPGPAMLARVESLRRVGGWRREAGSAWELDWLLRARAAGLQLLSCEVPMIKHPLLQWLPPMEYADVTAVLAASAGGATQLEATVEV